MQSRTGSRVFMKHGEARHQNKPCINYWNCINGFLLEFLLFLARRHVNVGGSRLNANSSANSFNEIHHKIYAHVIMLNISSPPTIIACASLVPWGCGWSQCFETWKKLNHPLYNFHLSNLLVKAISWHYVYNSNTHPTANKRFIRRTAWLQKVTTVLQSGQDNCIHLQS